jgi:hypothetical protein
MPNRVWRHDCPADGELVWAKAEVCPRCGVRGTPDGWGYSIIERMGAYQRRTRLKPIGDHRPLADQLLTGLFCVCRGCGARGLLDTDNEDGWCFCPACDGTGYVVQDNVAFELARAEVLKEFPDAAVEE